MDSRLEQAKEWAWEVTAERIPDTSSGRAKLAAAKVIQSLPDQWVDAEKVQAMIDNYKHARDSNAEGTEGWVINHLMVSNLESLLTPPLPTLADMTHEERKACQWMQARLDGGTESVVIVDPLSEKAWVMWDDGMFDPQSYDKVTPLPDLPKLEWPGSVPENVPGEECQFMHPPECDCEDALPRPEDVPAGEPWIVLYGDQEWVGVRAKDHDFVPWSIVRMDGLDDNDVSDSDITLVSRLVPERKESA